MTLESITISLKDKMEAIRSLSGNDSSAQTFASLYMWASTWDLSVMLGENVYTVVEGPLSDGCFYFPCGERRAVKEEIGYLAENYPGLTLHYLTSPDAEFLEKEFPDVFDISAEPDSSEYLYDVEQYCELSGGDYIRIRNRIHHAENNGSLSVLPVTEENVHLISGLAEQWQIKKGLEKSVDLDASTAFEKAFFKLGGEGVVVYDGGVPVAATAGYPLSVRVFDYAYSKAVTDLKGLSDYSKNALARMIRGRYEIINGEEDLGVPGLRKMKENMCPVGKTDMFTAVLL